MAMIKGDPVALAEYKEHKAKALAKTAPERKAAAATKSAANKADVKS